MVAETLGWGTGHVKRLPPPQIPLSARRVRQLASGGRGPGAHVSLVVVAVRNDGTAGIEELGSLSTQGPQKAQRLMMRR